ncbi:hypothetical protein KKF84_11910 [Myxococcota bacterium]|nr:hypothetical protein [Myxococcota bacterium]MBU1536018.1 hypothetical protein [Myxococcota bacterium]
MSTRRLMIGILVVCNLGLYTCNYIKTKKERDTIQERKSMRLPDAPPKTLTMEEQCGARVKQLRGKLDGSFQFVVAPPFVVAGDMDHPQLEKHTLWSVVKPAKALWTSYFKRRPDQVITVLLFSGQKSYRKWASALFGHKDVSYFGYYTDENRTLVMDINTGGGTLIHELTHALIVYDFPNVPQWFNEGLASLHEGCRVGEKEIVGVLNWRLPILQKAIASKKLRSIKELTLDEDFYGAHVDENYAQARYLMMYAQKKGVLATLYRNMRDNGGKLSDYQVLTRVFGGKAEQLESEFIEWAQTLVLPR